MPEQSLWSMVITVLLAGILTDNMVLAKFLGICPFLGVSKKLNTAFAMGMAVILVMLLATAVTYPIYVFLLIPYGLEYLQTIAFILVIAALVQMLEVVMKRFLPPLYKALGIYLPLITTNCAVLGITLLHFTNQKIIDFAASTGAAANGYAAGSTFLVCMANALGAGAGFLLSMILFAGVRARLEKSNVPKFLQGLPITLIAAAIVALSFLGFAGVA